MKPTDLQPLRIVTDAEVADALAARKSVETHLVAHYGTTSQLERYAADLLPEDELCALAREQLYKPFGGLARYSSSEKIKVSELRHQSDCAVFVKESEIRRADGGEPFSPETQKRIARGIQKYLIEDAIDFETCAMAELDKEGWQWLKAIESSAEAARKHPYLAGGTVVVEPLTHWATCRHCQAEIDRSTAKVHIHWAGRTLTREYLL